MSEPGIPIPTSNVAGYYCGGCGRMNHHAPDCPSQAKPVPATAAEVAALRAEVGDLRRGLARVEGIMIEGGKDFLRLWERVNALEAARKGKK